MQTDAGGLRHCVSRILPHGADAATTLSSEVLDSREESPGGLFWTFLWNESAPGREISRGRQVRTGMAVSRHQNHTRQTCPVAPKGNNRESSRSSLTLSAERLYFPSMYLVELDQENKCRNPGALHPPSPTAVTATSDFLVERENTAKTSNPTVTPKWLIQN